MNSQSFKKVEREQFGSLGQKHLYELRESIGELARRSGLPKASLSSYRSGGRNPSAAAIQRMHETLGIPAAAWGVAAPQGPAQHEQAPAAPATPARQEVPTAQDQAPITATPEDADPPRKPLLPTDRGGHQSRTVQEIDALLTRANETLRNMTLTPVERSKAASEARSLLRLRADVVRKAFNDQDVQDDAIVRENPTFKQLVRALGDALVVYPEALRAASAVLKKFPKCADGSM